MLRDPSLVPLSRQHQHALALCTLIERRRAGPEELERKTRDLYEVELRHHIDIEERILFPAIREGLAPAPLVEQLVAEHREMERLVAGLPQTLEQFAAALRSHIEREERDLFEDIQKRLPREVLDRLGRVIHAEVVRICLSRPAAEQ